ncbi:hypothetical protein [Ekhidna sp.]|uniref:hypothetical protein n=1 Tax=Ekhidna sp. TaxID=2608089 RepID=UPI0032EE1FA6
MKKLTYLVSLLFSLGICAQYNYEPTGKNPYGQLNPEAPKQTADFSPLIGTCICKSVTRVDQNTWADTVMMNWTFKYIMNGMAVQDETLKEDGAHSGSIRQYNIDSAKWYVHYYSSSTPTPTLSSWEGNKNDDGNIVLYRDQAAPNSTPGFYRLTFSNISEKGYNWAGEWVNKTETFTYPTWRIFCRKKEY